MKIAGAVLGFLILAAVFYFWVRAYRAIKGDDSPPLQLGARGEKPQRETLEDFIAAYRRGEAQPRGQAVPSPAPAPAPSAAAARVPPEAAAKPAPATVARRETFLSGGIKLAYLSCKSGLRDHHVFAYVPLQSLPGGGASAGGVVDLLICNAAFSPVAAIDVIDPGTGPAQAAKAEQLRALGIRYLRLSAKSLPRPEELHALLYKM